MASKTADAMPVSLRPASGFRPMWRQGGPRGRRVLLAVGADRLHAWRSGLMAAGHHVVTVPDPEAALDVLGDEAFDVFLLDLMLPEALETAKLYRFLSLGSQWVPVVGLTEERTEAGERHGGALCGCLSRDGGPAALGGMFPGQFRAELDPGGAARVVDFGVYRQARGLPHRC